MFRNSTRNANKSRPLCLEILEDRLLLAADYIWNPKPGNENWSQASNWYDVEKKTNNPAGPMAFAKTDTIKFDAATSNSDSTDDMRNAVEVASLTINNGYTGTVTINTSDLIVHGGSFASPATIQGPGKLTISGAFSWTMGTMGSLEGTQGNTVVTGTGRLNVSQEVTQAPKLVNRTLEVANSAGEGKPVTPVDPALDDRNFQLVIAGGLDTGLPNQGGKLLNSGSVLITNGAKFGGGIQGWGSVTTGRGALMRFDLRFPYKVSTFFASAGTVQILGNAVSLADGSSNSGKIDLRDVTSSLVYTTHVNTTVPVLNAWNAGTSFIGKGTVSIDGTPAGDAPPEGQNLSPVGVYVDAGVVINFQKGGVGFTTKAGTLLGPGKVVFKSGDYNLAGLRLSGYWEYVGSARISKPFGSITVEVQKGATVTLATQTAPGGKIFFPALDNGARLNLTGGQVKVTASDVILGPATSINLDSGSKLILAVPVDFSQGSPTITALQGLTYRLFTSPTITVKDDKSTIRVEGGGVSSIRNVYVDPEKPGSVLDVSKGSIRINGVTYKPAAGKVGLQLLGPFSGDGAVLSYPANTTLQGAGSVQASAVVNGGVLIPGGSGVAGIISLGGDWTESSTSALTVALGGTSPGTGYSQVQATGYAQLGGVLTLSLLNGYSPTLGSTYQILSLPGSYTGTFASVTDPSFGSGYDFAIAYNSTNVTLTAVTASTAAPTVTGLSTTTGGSGGGTATTITGTNFTDATAVLFGTKPASQFTVVNSTTITAVSPANPSGTLDVTVVNPKGTSATSSSDKFTVTAAPAPTVTSLGTTSDYVTGGALVTVNGTNLLGTSAVNFGTNPAAWFQIISATQLQAYDPGASGTGTVDVTVTTPSGVSATGASDHFTLNAIPVPTLTGLGVSSGYTGGTTPITLTGTGFTNADAVLFGSVTATSYTINSDTSITVTPPPESVGTVDVSVATTSGSSALSSSDRYGYVLSPAPSVSGLDVTTGSTAGNTSVVISGTNFTGATGVFFGTVAAPSFTINTDNQIVAVSPSQTSGTVDVTIVTPTGVSATNANDLFAYTAAAAPAVNGLSATTGGSGGGNLITVNGTGFIGATGVSFGTVAAPEFTVLSDVALTVTVPAQAAGTVDVTVTTPSGTSPTGAADQYTLAAASAPTVTGVTPNTGSALGGATVLVSGTGFTGASAVNFGTTSAAFTINSDSVIEAVVPFGISGTTNVTVTTPSGTSSTGSADLFTASAVPVPAVTGLSVSSGTTGGGTLVVVSGSGFTGAVAVNFGSLTVYAFTVNNDGQLTVLSPPGASGTVDLTVTTAGGTSAAVSGDRFTFAAAPTPAVTGLGTSTGSSAGGTTVAITGTNFTGASAVSFGTVAAPFVINSDTSITATAPSQPAGVYDVTVTTPTGTSASTSSDHFTVTAAAAPAVTGLSVSTGTTAGGTLVTVTGSSFTGASAVNFGSVPAPSFVVNSDTSISAYAPPQAAGTVDVTITTASGTSPTVVADHFVVTAASVPAVTGVTPASGNTPGGETITILGSAFTGATAVSFGGIAAPFTVNSDTSITATAPPQAAGTVDIKVTTYSGTSSAVVADEYVYNNVTAPAPVITAVGPNTGATGGGQSVVITGTNFSGATAVKFGTTVAAFTIVSDTQINATAPAGTAGAVDVRVTTNNGTSATGSSDVFTYLATAAPTVTGLGTTNGGSGGGTSVAITGTNFTSASAVTFGGGAAAFTVNSATSITATSRAQGAGVVDVVVTTPSGSSPTGSADRFTYTAAAAPTVTSLGTSSGTTGGGTSVVITGTNLLGTTGVFFGGVPAPSFVINSNTQVTAVSPANSSGTIPRSSWPVAGAGLSEKYEKNDKSNKRGLAIRTRPIRISQIKPFPRLSGLTATTSLVTASASCNTQTQGVRIYPTYPFLETRSSPWVESDNGPTVMQVIRCLWVGRVEWKSFLTLRAGLQRDAEEVGNGLGDVDGNRVFDLPRSGSKLRVGF